MRSNLLFILLAGFLLITGCGKDEIIEGSSDPTVPGPVVQIEASVRGIVTDQNNNPLSNVMVENENERILTDDNGYFKFASENLLEGGARMKFEKSGFFTNYKFTNPTPGSTSYLKIKMVERTKSGDFNTSDGGDINLTSGASISFGSNGIVDANGNTYNGNVNVYAYWFNPEDPSITKEMPGDLRAINNSSEIVQLATFGMMAVELESDAGESLNLANGATATLGFPISSALQANAPDEIPLWSFDEQTAYWKEEGTAVLENGKYVGEVSHFSFWNCDAPFPVVKINGRLVDQDGNPIQWAEICISVTTSGMTGYGWSDQAGKFCGKVPRDKTLSFKVKDECGNVIYEEEPIGPYGSATDLGDIVINTNDYSNTIKGTLVDCDGMPVTNGYVVMTFENGYYTILDVNEEGEFEGYVNNCQSQNFTIQGFDSDNLTQTEIVDVNSVPGQPILLNGLPVCDDLGEYIRYKIKQNGEEGEYNVFPGSLTNIRVIMTDQNLSISAGLTPFWFAVDLEGVTGPGNYIPTNFFASGVGPAGESYNFICNENDTIGVDKCDFEITITSLGVAGEYIIGEFIATNVNTANTVIDICGDFRVKLDQMFESASVEGVVWNDENKNGIREAGEPLLEGINVRFSDSDFVVFKETVTDSEGKYRFEGIAPGFEYYMALTNVQNYSPSLGGQTPDTALDNDFNIVANSPSQSQLIQTSFFQLQDGEDLLNMDGGIYERPIPTLDCRIDGDFFICQGFDATLFVSASGGDGNYTFSWSTGETDQTIVVWDEGYYSVTVTDGNGEFCETGIDVFTSYSTQVFLNVQNETCSSGNGIIDIIPGNNTFIEVYLDGIYLGNGNVTVDGLSEGVYDFVVIDEFGCELVYSEIVQNVSAYIGDVVWLDNPGGQANILDDGDTRLGGVKVRLYEEFNNEPIDSTTTTTGIDSSGFYYFEIELNGNYFIEVDLPDPMTMEFVDQGTDPNTAGIDSNIDPLTGRSDVFAIENCESDNSIDVGIREQ